MDGIDLFPMIKKKREKDAISLINGGFDVTSKDESQSTALHLACDQDMIDLIVSILKKDIDVLEQVDEKGRTALHRAVENGNCNALVALVTFGANTNPLDADGISPLENAIRNKDRDIVDLLCYFGCAILLDDWVIATMDEDYLVSLGEKDYDIMSMVIRQNERLVNMEYESIINPVYYIEPEKDENYFSELDIKLELNSTMPQFFLSISKESKDVTGGTSRKLDTVNTFSDIYEVRAWGNVPDMINLLLKITGKLRCNEQVHVQTLTGSAMGKEVMDKSTQNTAGLKEECIHVSVEVNIRTAAKFFIGVKDKVETFNVGKGLQNIKLDMEPNAEVSIPEGTFKDGGQLNINVSETKQWNYEDIEDPNVYLFTNAMDLTMTDGQQPLKPVTLKLPIHTPVGKDDDVVILAAHDDFENDDDWEVCGVKSRKSDHVVVMASHFSIYIATRKQNVKKSKQLATQACKKEHIVECFAMTKRNSDGKFIIVVELALKRKGKSRRKHWRRKGFDPHAEAYKDHVVKENTTYTIKFSGNIQPETKNGSLTFKTYGKTRCYRTIHLSNDSDSSLKGKVKIGRNVQQNKSKTSNHDQPTEVKSGKCGCWSRYCVSSTHTSEQSSPTYSKEQGQVALKFEKMLSLPIDSETTTVYTVSEAKVDPDDPQCTIPVLRWNSLKRLTSRLTEEECNALVRRMKLNEQVILALKEEKSLRENWYRKWRLARPNENQVNTLIEALRYIQKDDEADDIEDGLRYNEEYME